MKEKNQIVQVQVNGVVYKVVNGFILYNESNKEVNQWQY